MIDPKSSETTGYHLFLKPSGKLADELHACIKKLAEETGGPIFNPHITLLGPIAEEDEKSVIAKATQLATELAAFSVQLTQIGMLDLFFRSLFLYAHPSAELSGAHKKALEVFGMQDGYPYMPHLSLYYGNFPTEAKEKIAAGIVLPENLEFIVDKIYVYKTQGEATEWEQVAELALQ